MRTINGLDCIEEISILMKYLYLTEDNTITITNTLGISTEIKMNEDLTISGRAINGIIPNQVRSCTSDFTIPYMKDVVGYLKEQKPEVFPNVFKNRWEEIRKLTETNLGFNEIYRRKMNV